MKTKEEIEAGLAGFYGSESFHKFSILFPKHIITEGVKWLCDSAQSYWILDIIGSYHSACMKDSSLRDMQFWTLRLNKSGRGAKIICERDTGDVAITQRIPFTDFPLPEIKLYCAPSGDGEHYTILLPSEY